MRLATTLALLTLPLAAAELAAQGFGSPSRLAEIELERSRSCVGILERMTDLNAQVEPYARRGQRLQGIAQAIAIEEHSIVDSLNVDDSIEAAVRNWFETDRALARRYAAQQDASIAAERSAGRETIQATVTRAMEAVQADVSEILGANEELMAAAAPCDGAIFVRSAVLEVCDAGGSGPICEEARLPASEATRFRFVETPESIWEIEELRPWTQPTPVRVGPNGLDGGRTVGYTRVGNVVATVAFTPLLAPKEQTPPEILTAYEATNDSLGLSFDHPRLAFTPALGLRMALPQALDEEDGYILHFGPPDQAEVVWSGDADTGTTIEATVPLTQGQVQRLTSGDQLTVTAVAEREPTPDAVFAIGIGTVSQAPNAQAVLGYMESQLAADLARIVPPSGTR